MKFLYDEGDLAIVCVACGEVGQTTSEFAPEWRDCEIHFDNCFVIVCPKCGVFERDCEDSF